MRSSLIRRLAVLGLAFWFTPAAWAAAGKASRIVIVADSRMHTGLRAWLANLYNENLAWFTLLTVLVIPTLGALLGTITEFLLTRLGINLKSRVLAEH